jgi:hypothetical protein
MPETIDFCSNHFAERLARPAIRSDFENFATVALQNGKLVTSKSGQFSTQQWEQPLPGESIFDFTVASNLGQTNPSTVGTPNDAGLSNCL